MKLSDASAWCELDVVRDHEFENLGFVSDDQSHKLVFVESRSAAVTAARAGVACAVASADLAPLLSGVAGLAISRAPRRTFIALHNHLTRQTTFYGASTPTEIDPSADVHPRAWIAPRSVRIGPHVRIEPNATILEGTVIGSHGVVGPGAVIGAIGFQVTRSDDGVIEMAHAGRVELGEHVHVHANAVIARALFRQATSIGRHSRVGNLAFISHNVRAGTRCMIGHLAVVNGNVTIGEDVWIGPNATIAHDLEIGARARVSLGATVIRNVPAGQCVTGSIAIEHRRMLRHIAAIE